MRCLQRWYQQSAGLLSTLPCMYVRSSREEPSSAEGMYCVFGNKLTPKTDRPRIVDAPDARRHWHGARPGEERDHAADADVQLGPWLPHQSFLHIVLGTVRPCRFTPTLCFLLIAPRLTARMASNLFLIFQSLPPGHVYSGEAIHLVLP